jgi:fructose-specific phosphotransferase system IIC component
MRLKRAVYWLVFVPIAAAVIAFAVANRQWITVSFDPLNRSHPFATVDMPLWALFFCGAFCGILAGWLVAWIGQGKHRKAARQARIELLRTQQMVDRQRAEQTALARQDSAA